MTYRALFNMKFGQGIPTLELQKRFPRDERKILKLALLELPVGVLKSLLRDRKELFKVLNLRKDLFPGAEA